MNVVRLVCILVHRTAAASIFGQRGHEENETLPHPRNTVVQVYKDQRYCKRILYRVLCELQKHVKLLMFNITKTFTIY